MTDIKLKKVGTLMDVWNAAWKWMHEECGITFSKKSLAYQSLNKTSPVSFSGRSPESMAYFLTEHFEDQKEDPPEHLKEVIYNYKIQQMEMWGWPEWGYKDVKHLKPKNKS